MDNKSLPILGSIFKNTVFNNISVAYDVTTTYMQGTDRANEILREVNNFNLRFKMKKIQLKSKFYLNN